MAGGIQQQWRLKTGVESQRKTQNRKSFRSKLKNQKGLKKTGGNQRKQNRGRKFCVSGKRKVPLALRQTNYS